MSPALLSLVALLSNRSYIGFLTAVLFFSISLSPSLLPRPLLLQGILSGTCLALGYGVGVCMLMLWRYFQLPELGAKSKKYSQLAAALFCATTFVSSIIFFDGWQEHVRELVAMPAVGDGSVALMTLLAVATALLLFVIAKVFQLAFLFVKKRLDKYISTRLANAFSALLVAFIVFSATNNYLASKIVAGFDDIYALADATTDRGIIPPAHPLATGSAQSLVNWDDLGRRGQSFVSTGPNKDKIAASVGSQAAIQQPLRVYVGLNSRDTMAARAELALQELIRVDGFARSKLIIATPTGTGWLDDSAVDSLEYLHGGDTAIVAMQYSYLPSWLTLLVDPSLAKRSAAALYRAIHGYWATLPKHSRPDVYLFGLSLGAYAAEAAINPATVIKDPIQGALLAGAPFTSTIATQLMRIREPGSTQWLPIIDDGSMVRFSNQANQLNKDPQWQWGPMRFVYIQYPSDPMVFFSLDLWRREPDWLQGERGPDVSPQLRWYPIITFVQILFDLPMADKAPRGHSHTYSASSYIDGWIEVTQPQGLTVEREQAIRAQFKGR